jgi:TP901 family phage tail tape measure protein
MAANDGTIDQPQVITDAALKAPLELAENLKAPIKQVGNLVAVFKTLNKEIKGAGSVIKLKDETKKLVVAQSELDKVNKQLASTLQKNNEEYIKQQIALIKLKQEIKEKIALQGRDAETVNKLNASEKVLNAALEANRRKYKEMATEEERASEAGVRLLRVINQQAKEVDELRVKQGQYNQRVGAYEEGILNAYNKIQQLNKANKELISLQGKLSQTTAQDKAEFDRLAVAIQNNNTQINQYNQVINKAQGTVKGFVTQLLSAAGLVGGLYLVYNAISSIINVNKQFEKSLSDLSALTGATGKDLEFYKEQAIAIGAETKRSGADVVEAFKLIGGARPELLAVKEDLAEVTKQAIVLANASGLELPEAADALAGALNQLQLPASEAARVINTLAKGAQAGAAEVPQINEALQDFGAVLKTTNGSIEEGVALIEVLADRQIKGAQAGVALRNVLLRLSAVDVLPRSAKAQLAKFGVDLKVVGDNTLPLNVRLKELGKIAGDASALVKVFGTENFVAGNIILNNVEKFEKLTTAVTGTNSAYEQAAIATDNLTGDQQEAVAATEALITTYGTGLNLALRKIVQTYTFFVNLLRGVPKFIEENKTEILALGGAIIALNGPLIASTAATLADIAAKKLYSTWTAAADLVTKRFFTTLSANPFGVILAGLAAVVIALQQYDKHSSRAQKIDLKTKEINEDLAEALKSIELSRKNLNTSIDDYLKKTPAQQEELRREAQLRKETALRTLEEIEAKKEKLKMEARELTATQKTLSYLKSLSSPGITTGIEQAIYSAENAAKIEDQFKETIERVKKEIEGFDEFITGASDAGAEQAVEQIGKEKNAFGKLQLFRIEQAIKAQEEIRDSELNTLDKRLAAEDKVIKLQNKLAATQRDLDLEDEKLTESERLLINEKYQAEILEVAKKGKEEKDKLRANSLEEERRLAETTLKREQQIAQNIFDFEKSTYQQRTEALVKVNEAKQALLEINYEREIEQAKGNAVKLLQLQKEYNSASEDLARELQLGLSKNFFDEFSRKQNQLGQIQNDAVTKQIEQLNQVFLEGGISAKEYSKKRTELEKNTNTEILTEQMNFISAWLEAAKLRGENVTELERALADARFAVIEDETNRELELAEKKAQKLEELENKAYETVIAISSNIAARKQMQLDSELNALKANYEQQVELAGDNEKRKAQLKKEFDAKEKQIQLEKGRLAQRQARFEKIVNTSRAIINTSRAVTEVLPNIPLAVIIGALGALEIAQIASAPIPQFFKGGKTKGGNIIAGELGRELMIYPNKEVHLTPDRATLLAPPAGTEIVDHKKTMRALAMAALAPTDFSPIEKNGSAEVAGEIRRLRGEMRNNTRPTQIDYLKSGATIYEVKKENENFEKIVRKFSMGSWVK